MTTLERLNELLMDELGLDEPPSLDATLTDLGADSLDRVSLTIALEDTFNIEIGDDEGAKLITVRDVYQYIDKHIAPAARHDG